MERRPAIISIYMSNVSDQVAYSQKTVVDKFNKSGIQFYQFKHNELNDSDNAHVLHGRLLEGAIEFARKENHDAILFLDIDCIPLSDFAIDYCFEQAYNGKLIGSVQRSNHIENNQHLYAAQSNFCFLIELYDRAGKPTLCPTNRGDTAEELTFRAEEIGAEVELFLPKCYDAPPYFFGWEQNYVPYWALADGMPYYGIGTTFANHLGDLFWHNFQICQPGQERRFISKCQEILNG